MYRFLVVAVCPLAGEYAFTRGQLDDAMIALERTYAQTDGSGQENIALCGDFLSLRLSLFGQGAPRHTPLGRYELLQQQHNAPWVRFWDACCAYYYALLGQEEAIPEPFRLHRLERINFLVLAGAGEPDALPRRWVTGADESN